MSEETTFKDLHPWHAKNRVTAGEIMNAQCSPLENHTRIFSEETAYRKNSTLGRNSNTRLLLQETKDFGQDLNFLKIIKF